MSLNSISILLCLLILLRFRERDMMNDTSRYFESKVEYDFANPRATVRLIIIESYGSPYKYN